MIVRSLLRVRQFIILGDRNKLLRNREKFNKKRIKDYSSLEKQNKARDYLINVLMMMMISPQPKRKQDNVEKGLYNRQDYRIKKLINFGSKQYNDKNNKNFYKNNKVREKEEITKIKGRKNKRDSINNNSNNNILQSNNLKMIILHNQTNISQNRNKKERKRKRKIKTKIDKGKKIDLVNQMIMRIKRRRREERNKEKIDLMIKIDHRKISKTNPNPKKVQIHLMMIKLKNPIRTQNNKLVKDKNLKRRILKKTKTTMTIQT